ncbi:MAG: DUF1707 domain-containing protein [Spirochaetaceae bacterium]
MTTDNPTPRRFGLPKIRQAALDRLARGYADDDIEIDDYERRTEAVNAAESVDEIARIMADVPDFSVDDPALFSGSGDGTGGVVGGAGARPPARAGSGAAPAQYRRPGTPAENGRPATRLQVLGDREYDLADMENGALRVLSMLGDSTVSLADLRPGEEVVLTHYSLLGDMTIIVPAGCEITRRHVLLLGDEQRQGRRSARPGGQTPRVVLRGFKLLGDVTILEE